MLAAQGKSAALLGLHIIQVVLIVIFTAIGALVFHTAAGIAAGEAAAGWVSAVICLTVVSRLVKRLSSDDAVPNDVAVPNLDTEREAMLTEVLP
jgi:hypothetical protein